MSPPGKTSGRKRLDVLLTERGLAPSREKAQAAVLAGLVKVDGARVDKPGTPVRPEAEIVLERTARFVGRGGEKLDGALDRLGIDVTGARALDVGASTGGFTDCLLQRGAASVVALDVGRGQLDWKLRNDPRVLVVEGVNVRYLDPASIPSPFDLVVVDVSFISLRLVLPVLFPLLRSAAVDAKNGRGSAELKPDARAGAGGANQSRGLEPAADSRSRGSHLSLPLIMALVKPQFEAGRGKVGRRGVVVDPEEQIGAILRAGSCAPTLSAAHLAVGSCAPASPAVDRAESAPDPAQPIGVLGLVESPLHGAEGNREFFLAFGRGRGLDGETLAHHARRVVAGETIKQVGPARSDVSPDDPTTE